MKTVLKAATAVFVVIMAWAGAIEVFSVESYFMPGPFATLETLVSERSELWAHTRVTIAGTALGMAASVVFAVSLAAVSVSSAIAGRALLPLAITLRSVPVVAIAPLITLFAGRGLATSVICVTIVSFFPVMVNTASGLRATTPEMRELMHVTGANRRQTLRFTQGPVAVPYLFAGLRSASAVAVLGALLAEWLTGVKGLGSLLTLAAALRDLELLWSVVIVATALSLVTFWGMQAIERRLVAWSKGAR